MSVWMSFSFSYNNKEESEVFGSRHIGCLYNLPITTLFMIEIEYSEWGKVVLK